MDVDGGNTNSHTLTGLINGQTYTISIVGTSSSVGLPREPVSAGTVGLGKIANLSTCLFTSMDTVMLFSYFLLCHP